MPSVQILSLISFVGLFHVLVHAPAGGDAVPNNVRSFAKRGTECVDPDESSLRIMLEVDLAENPNAYDHSRMAFSATFGSTNEAILLETSNFTTHRYALTQCPRYFLSTLDTSMEERTLCPWRYVINNNPARLPRDIPYAQCECRECINPQTGDFSRDLDFCRPVIHEILVAKRTGECENGLYTYRRDVELIPVACVCSRFESQLDMF
ncbi:interleukin-17C-like [Diadema antillarum]|uniref:interleukin-17C-like n=1 Tax=Diadema antillarum TaxID=105358 RepID=UPI003A8BEE19